MTPQQKRLYDIIKAELDATGVCPSYEEMRVRMGMTEPLKADEPGFIDAPQNKRQPHPNSAKVLTALKQCALEAGASVRELRSRELRIRLHPARQQAARILVHEFGMTMTMAGKALNKDRTTIRELLKNGEINEPLDLKPVNE